MPATSLVISNREMTTAISAGRARPLSDDIPELVKHWGDWWVSSPDGWLKITDAHLASRLDQARTRIDIAEDEQKCLRAQQEAEQQGGSQWLQQPLGSTLNAVPVELPTAGTIRGAQPRRSPAG
jgi:hypothetical protein